MRKTMTKEEAITFFNKHIRPSIPEDDKPMLKQAWNDWTDALCKEGKITPKQYSSWVHPL